MASHRYRIPGTTHPEGKARLSAAALTYIPGFDKAPRVVASGEGKVAETILALAREYGVPIHEDPDLAYALAALDIGEDIPPELYVVVAEVLAYIYRLAGSKPTL